MKKIRIINDNPCCPDYGKVREIEASEEKSKPTPKLKIVCPFCRGKIRLTELPDANFIRE